ncbi:MAG: SGNH/GDSL hydrolase family protein [Gammaproteobacteria bacterium]|nr:SGNH/GDSL hydrolase family protein [Gammaproteobacteria bacterium]
MVVLTITVACLSLSSKQTSSVYPGAWETEIAAYEAQDRIRPPPEQSIVFVGSSSIRLWRTLARDMAPMQTINRGFGGATLEDVVHHVDRIVIPYKPIAIVLFAGTNDVSGPNPKSPTAVVERFTRFVESVYSKLPNTPIYYIGITPTPTRWPHWNMAQQANRMIADHTNTDDRLHYIDTSVGIINKNGKPNTDLFQADGLHLNQYGYAIWSSIIKPQLLRNLFEDSIQ